MTTTLVYTTRPVSLDAVKPGSRIEYDGRIYRVFRFLPVVKPGGCMAIAVPYDALGGPLDRSVGLYFATRNATVLLVCAAEVPHAR
jgi:hypothetical protein